MDEPGRMFRGSELPRLLLLLAIAAGGWLIVWYNVRQPAKPPQRPPAADLPVPPPDRSVEFSVIQDKTPLTLRDNAAYAALLAAVRATTPAQLAAKSARNVFFSQIWERPERYRGVPIHLDATALRVIVQDELSPELTPKHKLYEVWVVTRDSQNNPSVLVCEDLPQGFPGGDNLSEHVFFNGYFLKLLAYKAGDVTRAAPMLVGRLQWIRYSQFEGEAESRQTLNWLIGGMSVLTLYALLRWGFHLRRNMSPAPPRKITHLPSDEIAPQALAQWVEQREELEGSESDSESEDRS